MEIIKLEAEEIKEKYPSSYEYLKARGIKAIIALYGKRKSSAYIYEYRDGYRLFDGSRTLFRKFLGEQNENFKTSESNPC